MVSWLGAASNCVSFSSHTFHPSLVLAKEVGLTTVRFSGPQMQPEQDWLPTSIPQTYLMVTSSSEEQTDGVVLIAHLLSLALPILELSVRCCLAPRSASDKPTNPAGASA